ncbi:MAG: trehalase family glycosidase [Vulcanimicrobiota bacterium]
MKLNSSSSIISGKIAESRLPLKKTRAEKPENAELNTSDQVSISGANARGARVHTSKEASDSSSSVIKEARVTDASSPGNEVSSQPRQKESLAPGLVENSNGSITTFRQVNNITPVSRTAGKDSLGKVFNYIKDSWQTLRRNAAEVASIKDSKAGMSIIYVPEQDYQKVSQKMGGNSDSLTIKPLKKGTGFEDVESHGLLYLPEDYVVPGGRFNEMYGWDSYFTVLGLLQDGETDLAQGMVKNMFYQVDNYGKVLNANRSYYLSRSSPPFQSSAVLSVFEKTGDREFLKEGIDHVIKEYNYWTNPQNEKEMDHLTPTGLSRYYSPVGKPCPEVEEGYYENHNLPTEDPQFCQHDRAERESGWDMTGRYGYKCADYNPVDLNSYLYKFEKDLATMYGKLEGKGSRNAKKWEAKAGHRKALINKHCWNEEKGMFVDYNFKEGKQSDYNSLATFAPLWAGLASDKQAEKVMENLDKFEMAHGLSTSDNVSDQQWDHPSGWAPLHILASKGMRNYGFHQDADRVSTKFMKTIVNNFDENGGILEKYNVEEGTADVDVGYGNQVGFGWTNAAFLELHSDMTTKAKLQLKKDYK